MYYFLLSLHSLVRWLVLLSLLVSLCMAYRGLIRKTIFGPAVNKVRHWTATIAHIQMLIGMTLYFQSPIVKTAVADGNEAMLANNLFFRYLHISLMLISIVVITIGSAKAKRAATDPDKYTTMLRWFAAGLIIILLAIPWPFYDYISRPLIRKF